mmetsp:Transcript_22408/g.52888  ORF Transcript_22408/g.52888 Transcript_22408/m.52888 type:complete len:343 (-) Transcript_22408:173-1201(-)
MTTGSKESVVQWKCGSRTENNANDETTNENENDNRVAPTMDRGSVFCKDEIAHYQSNNSAILSHPLMADYQRRGSNEQEGKEGRNEGNQKDKDVTKSNQRDNETVSTRAEDETDSETKTKAAKRIRVEQPNGSNEKANKDKTDREGKVTILRNKKSTYNQVSSTFYLWKKMGKKRKKYPTEVGQFDDAPEEPIASSGMRSNGLPQGNGIHPMQGKEGQSQAHAQAQTQTQTQTQGQQFQRPPDSALQFAVGYLQNQRHSHQHQQVLELYRREQHMMQHHQQHQQHQGTVAAAGAGAQPPIMYPPQYQTLTKLQMELQAKIMKAHIEYNKGLLADATKNRRHL